MRVQAHTTAQSPSAGFSPTRNQSSATAGDHGRMPEVVLAAMNHSGRPLDSSTMSFMEPRFGRDFSGVRVHSDQSAADAARAIQASAFTVGQNIYFGADAFRPATHDGNRLLAHELAHTVQSGPADALNAHPALDVSQPGDAAEVEAESVADAVMAARPPGRLTPVPISAARKAISRADLRTNGGIFKVTNYSENDSDPGHDTDKSVGAKIDITFTPAETVVSNKISFVQIVKPLKDGTSYLFENMKPRATDARSGDAGWAVDRVAGKKSANYAQQNDGTAGGNTIFGKRTDRTTWTDAWMHDDANLNRKQGKTLSMSFTTFALDNTNNKYLGAISWGAATTAAGATTKKTEAVFAQGNPGGVQKAALEGWNKQAALADTSKRNAPDQERVPVP